MKIKCKARKQHDSINILMNDIYSTISSNQQWVTINGCMVTTVKMASLY